MVEIIIDSAARSISVTRSVVPLCSLVTCLSFADMITFTAKSAASTATDKMASVALDVIESAIYFT